LRLSFPPFPSLFKSPSRFYPQYLSHLIPSPCPHYPLPHLHSSLQYPSPPSDFVIPPLLFLACVFPPVNTYIFNLHPPLVTLPRLPRISISFPASTFILSPLPYTAFILPSVSFPSFHFHPSPPSPFPQYSSPPSHPQLYCMFILSPLPPFTFILLPVFFSTFYLSAFLLFYNSSPSFVPLVSLFNVYFHTSPITLPQLHPSPSILPHLLPFTYPPLLFPIFILPPISFPTPSAFTFPYSSSSLPLPLPSLSPLPFPLCPLLFPQPLAILPITIPSPSSFPLTLRLPPLFLRLYLPPPPPHSASLPASPPPARLHAPPMLAVNSVCC
jgi:hypothetical protein